MGHSTFRLGNGRDIGISAAGDPLADRLVVFFHPTPGAGIFDPDPTLTGSWGVHILALERPGYGGSTPFAADETPTFRGMADDAAEFLLSAEGMARSIQGVNYGPVGVIGWSTGCLVALHLAAQYPDLVDKIALVDPPRPASTLDGAARRLSLESDIADAIGRSLPIPPAAMTSLTNHFVPLTEAEETEWAQYAGLTNRVQRMVDDALTSGTDGVAADLQALANDDASTLARFATVPTLIVQSKDGQSADRKDAHWYARRLPHSRSYPAASPAEPAIVTQWPEILKHVAPHHGDIPPQDR